MDPMALTFDHARKRTMARLDAAYAALRGVVADPDWNNDKYPPYQKAAEEFMSALAAVQKLNAAEMEAKRLPDPAAPKE